MMRRLFFTAFLCCLLAVNASAQMFYSGKEYGITIGGSQYFGDLNDNYGLKFVRPVGGAFLRWHLTPYISVRGSLLYTKIGYSDKHSDNAIYKTRNLSVESDIM
jgi:hypothetical protein